MIKLATLPYATAQEVFDQVRDHLLSQNETSRGDNGCLYHSADGLKCAAGCLVADHEYKKEMEGVEWRGLIDRGYVPETHKELISDLQRIHDNFNTSFWEDELISLSHKYNLKY